LYSPYGNLNLTPEESATVGFEVFSLLDKKLTFNTITFYREEQNPFGFYTNRIPMLQLCQYSGK
jgi:vitamin B12 transporter